MRQGSESNSDDVTACLRDARRLVVKIGSALLVDETTGRLRRDWLDALADDVARLPQARAGGHRRLVRRDRARPRRIWA